MRYQVFATDLAAHKADLVFETDDAAALARGMLALHAAVATPGVPFGSFSVVPCKPGPKGRPVHVRAVAEDYEGPLKAGDTFPTALDASVALGFAYSAVSIALCMAHRRGEVTAMVRGVEFQYADTLGHD